MTDQPSNEQTPEHHSPEKTKSEKDAPLSKKNAALLKIALVIFLILVISLISFGLWKSYQPDELELQGRVEAETIYVSTKVPSRIEELYVDGGELVKKGQPLVRLHSPAVENQKKQALAALQTALALKSTADRGPQIENIETLYANWQALKAQAALAQNTFQRGARLYQEGVIAKQRHDEMQAAATSSTQLAEAGYQQYLRAKRGSTPQQLSTADAQVAIAQAAVDEVNSLIAETFLHSPIDGIISKTYGNVSELVAMGVPIVSIIDEKRTWVSLNVREDHYADIYKRKELNGFIPALNKSAKFKIKEIEPQGDFATIKTTRQTGGYDIRSFKFHLVPVDDMPNLKVGMSVLFTVKEATK
ncbi:RND transporter [Acinetobacter sp. ANC 4558]|uniref:HlyD family secretion protein n=1 Tax=Acinetobacter sp. ANC 4558 TaxID=1977876 RepID=UPI000A35BCBA|nr:efflux RND transporter periplasmic adaptor subunit [Acinetobacter sp. ANC 4558]OTG87630.1 RND transporter [Acinetobacter sp. ANC 4558]